jgi:hypothetical protein
MGAIIEEQGGFTSSRTFSHELGHALGSQHDDLHICDCDEWDNYLMAPKRQNYNQINSWSLSKCSIEMIKQFLIESQTYQCLLSSNYDLKVDEQRETLSLPGQIYNSTFQCKQIFGESFEPCLVTKIKNKKLILKISILFFFLKIGI